MMTVPVQSMRRLMAKTACIVLPVIQSEAANDGARPCARWATLNCSHGHFACSVAPTPTEKIALPLGLHLHEYPHKEACKNV